MQAISALYDAKGIPKIHITDNTADLMKQFAVLIDQFKMTVRDAVRPYSCLCCRHSCLFFQGEIFGTLDQLRFMLEKNFDGRHFWTPSKTDKGLKIDSMFFPCTSEKVLDKDEL